MKELVIKSGKQLPIALKMVYAYLNLTDLSIQLRESEKGKIYYVVLLDVGDETYTKFEESFRTMTL